MRTPASLFLVSCLLMSGCKYFQNNKSDPPPARLDQTKAPTADVLVRYLNDQADHLATIKSEDVSLVAYVPGERVELRCELFCEKPRNFRLTGALLGMDSADFGSNNDQFWFWVKDPNSNSHPLYYCSYADYEKGVKLPMPFQPEWVVQALGMAKYDPNKQYKVEAKGNTFELIEETTAQGTPVRKITIFNARRPTDASYPQVIGHVVQDATTGKIICQATIRRMRQGKGNVSYPSDIVLEWPAEKMKTEIKIGRATLNERLSSQDAARIFTRPDWQQQKIDLARVPPSGSPTARDIRQAGGNQ